MSVKAGHCPRDWRDGCKGTRRRQARQTSLRKTCSQVCLLVLLHSNLGGGGVAGQGVGAGHQLDGVGGDQVGDVDHGVPSPLLVLGRGAEQVGSWVRLVEVDHGMVSGWGG